MKLTSAQQRYCIREIQANAHSNKMKYDNSRLCDIPTAADPMYIDRNIRRSGSHIYFYDEIDEESQLILEQLLRDAIRELLAEHAAEIFGGQLSEVVTIHLNSPGGYGHCGMALYDYIKTSQIPINCVVEGFCASAATLIFLACPNRIMSPSSTFLMHQCSWGAYGQDKLMQDLAGNARKSMAKLRAIYAKETKIGIEYEDPQVRDAYIQNLLEHDKEFDVDDCIKLGIIPEHSEEDELDDVELSEERMKLLEERAHELAKEQLAEDKAKEEKEKVQKAKDEKSKAKKDKKEAKVAAKKAPKEDKVLPKEAPAKKRR